MVIVGLTGSIGMGKSNAALALRRLGIPVHDADAAVHRLLARGGSAVAPIAAAFPGAVVDAAVDRQALGKIVFADRAALKQLESIVHPLVQRSTARFLLSASRRRERLVVLDVPLLFEGGGAARVDRAICVSAPGFLQRQRVMARTGMTEEKLKGILSRQMPDALKRRRADFVVNTGRHRGETFRDLHRIVRRVKHVRGRRWPLPGYLPRPKPLPLEQHARNRHRH